MLFLCVKDVFLFPKENSYILQVAFVILSSAVPILFCWHEGEPNIRKTKLGTSLIVQWLRLCASIAGAWVQSLVQELISPHAT